jgi:murein DD-endopeptidase MepM/ murein hydrolase activator NlpD
VTEGDQVDLERLDAAAVTVEAERERLHDEQRSLEELLEEQQLVLAEAEELRESRALAAADARARVEGLDQEHDDLEAEEAELEELVRQRQEEERQRREEEERQRREEEERRRAEEQRAAEEASAAEREAERQAERDAERQAERQAEREAEQGSSTDASGSSGSGSGSSSGGSEPAASTAGGGGGGGGYAWPLCAPVTSEYGPRWGRTHRGIDQGASPGTAIGASKAGTVIFAGWQGGYGNLTLIDHGDGVVTAYAHQTSFAVGQGTRVSQGQTIGYVGNTGNSTGPHLHFETRVNGTAVNPRQYLSGSPC